MGQAGFGNEEFTNFVNNIWGKYYIDLSKEREDRKMFHGLPVKSAEELEYVKYQIRICHE